MEPKLMNNKYTYMFYIFYNADSFMELLMIIE